MKQKFNLFRIGLIIFILLLPCKVFPAAWGGWGFPPQVQLSNSGIGTTSTDGLVLVNPKKATAGSQQISPRIRWTGQGWKTDATAGSQTVDWKAELVPVQGAANPQARLDFKYQINGGGYISTLSLLNNTIDIIAANIDLDNTTFAAQNGILKKNGNNFIHNFNYGYNGTVTTDGKNVFIGIDAGNLTMGSTATEIYHASYNTFAGTLAGYNNTTGYNNTFAGTQAGYNNTTGYYNTFAGRQAGYNNTTGYNNTFAGTLAGYNNLTGYNNTFAGTQAGYNNTTGIYNTFAGTYAGNYNTTGYNNTFAGTQAGWNPANDIAQYRITTDTNMILLGYGATKDNVAALDNSIAIGNNVQVTKSNQVKLGNSSIGETLLSGNIGLNNGTFGTSAAKVVSIGAGTAPTTSPADVGQMYINDINNVAGQAGFHLRDELGGVYKIGAGILWASNAEPTCAAGVRGTVNYVAGGAGVLDTFKVCRKDAADVYAWVSLF